MSLELCVDIFIIRVVYCIVMDSVPSERCDKIGMMIARHRDGSYRYRDGEGEWLLLTLMANFMKLAVFRYIGKHSKTLAFS